jgi:hypothetical protein
VGSAGGRASEGCVVANRGTVTCWYGVDLILEAIACLGELVPDVAAEPQRLETAGETP